MNEKGFADAKPSLRDWSFSRRRKTSAAALELGMGDVLDVFGDVPSFMVPDSVLGENRFDLARFEGISVRDSDIFRQIGFSG